ncbi:hypothetical protein BDZ94DRAFT_611186 [Collybia nuda]|uniref:Uncharacterized protein n=1 Tax=Collybia nuda TaxID=64659 RepID=A0A9P6CK27_9AGAR|nr:hypothetical protein BDZ94DRAFT_611186 [Collybia nuda]
MSDGQNYAQEFGIISIPAAAIFAAVYVPLLVWFIRQSYKLRTSVFFSLSLFCAIRIAAFVIRAILAGSNKAGQNVGLLAGDQILFSVGFFGLLYSAYTLVLDRETMSDTPPSRGIISQIMRNRRLYRMALFIAIGLGTSGLSLVEGTNSGDTSIGNSLHMASTIMFLVLVALLAYQTFILARLELKGGGYKQSTRTFAAKYGMYILLLISVLLLIREAFATATMNDLSKQNNEHFWYPLVALPEVLAVLLYTTPGLIPSRAEMQAARRPKVILPNFSTSKVAITTGDAP